MFLFVITSKHQGAGKTTLAKRLAKFVIDNASAKFNKREARSAAACRAWRKSFDEVQIGTAITSTSLVGLWCALREKTFDVAITCGDPAIADAWLAEVADALEGWRIVRIEIGSPVHVQRVIARAADSDTVFESDNV